MINFLKKNVSEMNRKFLTRSTAVEFRFDYFSTDYKYLGFIELIIRTEKEKRFFRDEECSCSVMYELLKRRSNIFY